MTDINDLGLLRLLKSGHVIFEYDGLGIFFIFQDEIREGMHRFSDSQGEFEAKVLNVLDDGRLVLLDAEGKARMYAFKEVQFVI